MNSDFGTFALRQVLNSLVVIGPILFLTGLSFLVFRESRKAVYVYLLLGSLFTVLGAACMVSEFRQEPSAQETLVEPARK